MPKKRHTPLPQLTPEQQKQVLLDALVEGCRKAEAILAAKEQANTA